MAEQRVQRRLAAILAADVVGYSRLMREDEAGTLAQLKTLRKELLDPKVEVYGGRIVKTTGDGILIEFPSAVDAVQLAVDVQQAIARRVSDVPENRRIEFRMGINIGDVVVEGDDLFGDGVNIASRLEGLAEPGCTCISRTVYEQVRHKIDLAYDDMGEQLVKNIPDPVHVYGIAPSKREVADDVFTSAEASFRRPAVAVLPFENISGDPEQEYFADGLTEEIITALSRWRTFPVIARNSTFAYKGQSPDIRKIGEDLAARYVVEGSVRKAANRVRVTAQLINSETGHHVWAERYDREIGDIFALQDEITQQIVAIIEPTIERDERHRITNKPPGNLAAWEYSLRGEAYIYDQTKEASEKAREMFYRAIELDPNYPRAYTGLAWTYSNDVRYLWAPDRDEWLRLLFESAQRAVTLDDTDAEARIMLVRGYVLTSQPDEAIAEATIGVQLNPHSAAANNIMGNALAMGAGRYQEALPWFERSQRLNSNDPRQQVFSTQLALANLGAERYEQAVKYAQDAIRRQSDFVEARIVLGSAFGHLGHAEMAQKSIEGMNDDPVQYVEELFYYVRDLKNRLIDGLRKAGLTE